MDYYSEKDQQDRNQGGIELSLVFNYSNANTTLTSDAPTRSISNNITYCSALVILGLMGFTSNTVILCRSQWKRVIQKSSITNVILINQSSLDLFASAFLVITYSLKVANVNLSGSAGMIVCRLFDNFMLIEIGAYGSVINLVIVSAERYTKIVQSIKHRKHFRKWMLYTALFIPWMVGFAAAMLPIFAVIDSESGSCNWASWAPPSVSQRIYGIAMFFFTYAAPLSLFAFFYANILATLRKRYHTSQVQNRFGTISTISAQGTGSGNFSAYAKTVSIRHQFRMVRTLILVIAFFVCCWTPFSVYQLTVYAKANLKIDETTQNIVLFIAFLNICIDPFLYVIKHESVKNSSSVKEQSN